MALPDCLKIILDNTLNIPAILGLRAYRIYVTKITHSGTRPGLGTRVRTDTELLVGDGYIPCEQVNAHDIFLSGGLLSDKDFKLTVVSPYTAADGTTKGTNKSVYNPPMSDSNAQIYFHIFGGSFPSDGQYFKLKWTQEDGNLLNYLYIEATAEKPGS